MKRTIKKIGSLDKRGLIIEVILLTKAFIRLSDISPYWRDDFENHRLFDKEQEMCILSVYSFSWELEGQKISH